MNKLPIVLITFALVFLLIPISSETFAIKNEKVDKEILQNYFLFKSIMQNATKYFKFPSENVSSIFVDKATGKMFMRNKDMKLSELDLSSLSPDEKIPVIIELKEMPLIPYKLKVEKEFKEKESIVDKSTIQTEIFAKVKSHETRLENIQKEMKQELARIGIEVKKNFKYIFNGLSAELTFEDIEKIKNLQYVKKVYPDREFRIFLDDSVELINATLAWQMNDTAKESILGKGIKIAIIDTGIDYTHPDLGGCFGPGCKVAGGWDVVNNDSDPMDDEGHGTHVAAIAAGNGIIRGVAPGATLLAYKVLDKYGRGHESWIIEGIERAVNDSADIISMSLGLSAWWFNDCYDVALSRVVDAAVDAGVTVVVAAGNDGPGSYSIASPGCAKKVITVGATCKPEQVGSHPYCSGIIASFSSRGPVLANGTYIEKPDVVAPGVEICAARYNDAYLENEVPWCLDGQHMPISGTSMSTPHVAGVAALLLQLHPDWKPEDVKNAIKATATNLGYNVNTQGAGLVDAYNATSISFGAIVKPSIFFLNETPTTQTFSLNKTFLIKNLENVSRSYNFSVNFTQAGIEAFLNQSSINLSAGEEKEFNLTISINNTLVPSRGWYWGYVVANSSVQTIRVPFRILINDQATIFDEGIKNGTKKCIYQYGIFTCPSCENCYYNLYLLDAGINDPDLNIWSVNKTIKIKNLRNDQNLTFNLSASIQQPGIELGFDQSTITVLANSTAGFNFSVKVNNSVTKNGIYYGEIILNSSLQKINLPFYFIKYHVLNLSFSETPGFLIVHDRSTWSSGLLSAPYNYSLVLLDKSGLYDVITDFYSNKTGEWLEYSVIKEGVDVKGLSNALINITDAKYLVNHTLLDKNGSLFERIDAYYPCIGGSEITHRESGLGYITIWLIFPVARYFSNVSSNYTYAFNVVCYKDVVHTIGNYTFGISNNINFQNNPAEFKKITYMLYPDPKTQNAFYFWLCGHGIGGYACLFDRFSPEIYYTPLIDEVYWNRYKIRMVDIESPYLFLNKTHLELQADFDYHLIKGAGKQILSAFNLTEVDRLTVGLSPIFWFGQFNNSNSEIRIYPYRGVQLWLFLDQDYSKFKQINTTYKLYNATGHLIKEDVFLSPEGYPVGSFEWLSYYTNITLPEPGKYFLETGRNYSIRDTTYEAKVNATFNTSKEDKNPPTITTLNLNSNNTLVDFILNDTNLTFNLDPIGGELTNVSAFVDRGYGWEKLNLSKTELYSAKVPLANITLSNYSFKIEAVDNSSNALTFSFQVPAAPKIFVSPEEIVDRVVEGGTSTKKLLIGNNETGLLKFKATPNYIFNYSMSEVSYNWEDGITGGIKTDIARDDEYKLAALPFNFSFYGSIYDRVYISSNGFLNFEDTLHTLLPEGPFPLNESGYRKIIAILGDDFYPPAPGFGGVWIKNATNPNRFIITYNNISHINSQGSNTSTFQVILYENGEIRFNYKEVGYIDNPTIGLNEGDGVRFNNYPTIPKNQSSILFVGVPSWLLLSPSSGNVTKDQKLEVEVTIDATKLKIGNYSANVEIESNDPYNSFISIPIKLEVIAPSPPSGGGGGGGFAPIITTETKTIASISPTVPITIGFEKSDILKIQEIMMETNATFSNVQITLKESSKPSTVLDPISKDLGKTYKYIEISTANITNENISKVKIKFKVDKQWIKTNNISEASIALQRLENTTWNKLSTSKIGEDANWSYYQAESPGLSIFSITGEFVRVICAAGTKRCLENKLQKCSSDGTTWETIEICAYGCNTTLLACNPAPECPPCPEPGNWGECIEGKRNRTVWTCGAETNYKCEAKIETEDCKMPFVVPLWLIFSLIISGVVILVGLIFWLRKKDIRKRAEEFVIQNIIKNSENLIGKKIRVKGFLYPTQKGVYVLYDDSGSLLAYGSVDISNGKYVVEGTLERTERGLIIFMEKVIPV